MPSIGQENLETVMIDFFGALRRGDFEAAAGLLDPDVSWQGLREEWVCHGREEVIDTFRWDVRIVKTPVRAPQANAFAERFVGTIRRECLDWLLILNRRHLDHVLRVFVDHYNAHRPHRSLALTPPVAIDRDRPVASSRDVRRCDSLGGLIHEYSYAA
jgi:putative transposase